MWRRIVKDSLGQRLDCEAVGLIHYFFPSLTLLKLDRILDRATLHAWNTAQSRTHIGEAPSLIHSAVGNYKIKLRLRKELQKRLVWQFN